MENDHSICTKLRKEKIGIVYSHQSYCLGWTEIPVLGVTKTREVMLLRIVYAVADRVFGCCDDVADKAMARPLVSKLVFGIEIV